MKEKYYIVLYNKTTREFLREYPIKNQNIAESQKAFYNNMTTNLKATIRVEEIK